MALVSQSFGGGASFGYFGVRVRVRARFWLVWGLIGSENLWRARRILEYRIEILSRNVFVGDQKNVNLEN